MPASRLLVFLSAISLFAQVTGQLNGNVEDATGSAVPNANVRVFLSGGSKSILDTKTGASGAFTISALRPDTYDLLIETAGFAPRRINTIAVAPGAMLTVPTIRIEVSSSTQTVEVTAGAGGVQLTSPEISSTLTAEQLQNLPIFDRQVLAPLISQPGVTGSRTVTTIHGLRPSFTNITLDGINVQDSVRTNALDFQPNRLTTNEIAEMTISTSNVDSSIAGNVASIAIATPSGGNVYRGKAYWANRNSYLAANDWFSNQSGTARPALNLNELGASVGGPIKRDKLLFFANYEAFRKRGGTPRTLTILTPTARQGIFQYRNAAGAVQQFDVLKASGLTIDPFIQNLLSQVPAGGNTNTAGDQLNTTGYTFNPRGNTDRDNVLGKLDYYVTTKQTLSVSYFWNREVVDRSDLASAGTFYTVVPPILNDNVNLFMAFAWRWSPSANLTNELRGGFDRQTGAFTSRADVPKYYITGTLFSSPITQNAPEVRKTNNNLVQDNATWVRGSHNLAFGGQFAPTGYTDVNYAGVYPSYAVGTNTTNGYGFNSGSIPGASSTDLTRANQLLASLAGILNTGTETFNISSRTSGYAPASPSLLDLRLNNLAFYFRDNWQVRPNLTLTLGVRWEYFGPVNVANGLLIEPKVVSGGVPQALLSNATLDFVPSPLYKRDLNNFAPNVGFAWNVFGDGRTSVRGGYAISYANDNLLNDIPNSINNANNNGLSTAQGIGNLKSFANAAPGIPVPAFQIPRTSLDNFIASAPPAQGLIDPNLATPYVQQWNLSLQHQFSDGLLAEVRYIGNHTVKQLRLIDYNQVDVTRGGFIQDFINARNNAQLALNLNPTGSYNPSYNAAIPGSKPLPFFGTLASGGSLTNATVAGLIRSGEAGTLAQTYQTAGFLPTGFSFFPNPLVLYSALLTNISNSSWNGLEAEVTKRSRHLTLQASYTFSKSLSDAALTRGLEAQLDNANWKIEKARTPFDTTHSFRLNHFVPLPFTVHNGFLNRVVSGWGLGGFLRVESGPPVSILSARGTLNRGARSGNNTVDTSLTLNQIKDLTGTFRTGNAVYWIDPSHINPANGTGVAADASPAFAGQIFFNPQPGSLGSLQRRNLDGPAFVMYDVSMVKNTRITERQSLEIRGDFYNVFNHPSFFVGDQNVNNPTFGQITGQNYTNYGVGPRLVQFGLSYKF